MERCTAAILLMLSLEALVAGRLSYAVADDGVDTIRLPSHGLADELETAARETGGEKKRPWKCCDVTQCNRRMPPGCRCMDAVERCDDACIRCQAHPSVSSKLICMDRFIGFDTGPSCTKPGNAVGDDVPNGPGVAGQEATAAVAATEELEARPWKCCDDTMCTKSAPPTCQCLDKVKKCAKTCKVCKKDGASSRYVCQDRYFGWPGPKCTKSAASGSISPEEHVAGRCRWPNCVDEDNVPNGIAARQHVTVAAAAAATEKEAVCEDSIAGGVEEARPWKCCDDTLCTRSAPPTCQCLDKVKKCAKTCKVCEKVGGSNGASSRYVCKDRYFGWPGPKCSKSVAADDRRGN